MTSQHQMYFPFTTQQEILDWKARYIECQSEKRQDEEQAVIDIEGNVEARANTETLGGYLCHSDFSEASLFREDVWHYFLKTLDQGDTNGTYDAYLKSAVWKVKRDKVIQRDGGQCVCGAQAIVVHHKTYDNIGKEPLSDLVMVCKECHKRVHTPRVPSAHPPRLPTSIRTP